MNTPGASGRGPGNSRGSWGEPRSHQPSVAKAFNEIDEEGRTKPSSYYDRMVDVMEELSRVTILLRPHAQPLVDHHSERKRSEERRGGKGWYRKGRSRWPPYN